MVPEEYPNQQDKAESVILVLKILMRSKSEQENIVAGLSGKLAAAIEKSNHIMAEDLIREAGYMLPRAKMRRNFSGPSSDKCSRRGSRKKKLRIY